MSEFQLSEGIIALSQAKTWDQAKLEWELENVYYEDEPDTCLCGHSPINEICELRNTVNGNRTIVGNICVNKFLGLPSKRIFAAVGGVKLGNRRAFNADTIKFARKSRWITEWEERFYLDTMRKRKLTDKQAAKRGEINALILKKIVNARPSESPV